MVSIDVILCCYNQEHYIVKALDSILCQKVDAEVRLIVADDGSSDRTLEIVKNHEAKSPFPFVYFKNNGNIGMQANYKRAFAVCKSEYVAILEGGAATNIWHNILPFFRNIQAIQCPSIESHIITKRMGHTRWTSGHIIRTMWP